MRKSVFTTVMVAVFAVMAMTPAFAGSLDQTNPPGNAAGRMSTLTEIYNCIDTGTCVNKSAGGFADPTVGPGSTGKTLDEIMGVAKQRAQQARVPKTGDSADGATGVSFPNPRFTVNAAYTVTDNLTGLIWLKNANLAATVSYNPDATGDGRVKWSNAKAFITALNTGAYTANNCGYTNWRLPTLRELQSLFHYGYLNPALSNTVGTGQWTTNGDPFDNVQTNYYWSATTAAVDPSRVRIVLLDDGDVSRDGKFAVSYVWPVR